MMDFNIQYGLSTEIFINGQLNPDLIIEEGCWYLCTDTAELFIGIREETGLTLKRVNEAIINQIPVKDLALKSDLESVKQEVLQTVAPEVDEVKAKVEVEIAPSVEEVKTTTDELKTWVENKEYLQDIDLEGFATKDELSGYILKTEVAEKADNIPFRTDKFVTKAFGGFTVGESLKGFTIAELLAKLLELVDEKPVLPSIPTEPNGIIDTIINNKLPMYSINSTGEVVALYYSDIIVYTSATASMRPTESGFYQIINDTGEVAELGYQELTTNNPDVPYIIALPTGIDFNTMVIVYTYDTLEVTWKIDHLDMSNDYDEIKALCDDLGVDISHIDNTQYTFWADLETGPSGKIHRFIITE